MKISIIAAMTKERIIGQGNKMPWHIPAELQNFKDLTMGKPMIMGRATFDSIGRRLLPGRKTIILTRDRNLIENGFSIANSIENALCAAGNVDEIMIVGGAGIYKHFLPIANKMYLSIINANYPGDVFFPEYDAAQWQIITEQKTNPDFTVQIFEKIS